MTIIKDILRALGVILGAKPSKRRGKKSASRSQSNRPLRKGISSKRKANLKPKVTPKGTAKAPKRKPRPGIKTAPKKSAKTVKTTAKTNVKKKAKAVRPADKPKSKPREADNEPVRTLKLKQKSKAEEGGKKNAKRLPGLKSTGKKTAGQSKDPGLPIGRVTHYFSRIKVCVIEVSGRSLLVGDNIWIKGRSTDLKQKAGSLQVESRDVKVAPRGSLVGLKVRSKVRVGDKVYRP